VTETLEEARAWLAEVRGWAAEWRPEDMNVRVHPHWLARKLATVRAEARREALEEAANIFDERAATHRHTAYVGVTEPPCGTCGADRIRAIRIRSLMEPQEKP
jgi:hypothetical protein